MNSHRRPSARALLVVAALALTLVVGATSGAVAGRLITSKDIKDGTIKTADLSKAVKQQLAKAGTPGAAGAQGLPGPQGPAGTAGAAGSRGADGTNGSDGQDGADGLDGTDGLDGAGSLTDWDYFGLEGASETDENGVSELAPSDDGITLTEPGNYLVSLTAVFTEDESLVMPILFAGNPGPGEPMSEVPLSFFLDSCSIGSLMGTCQTTFPVSVEEGDSVELPVFVPTDTTACETECGTPAYARVMVYRVGGDVADLGSPTIDPGCLCGPLFSGLSVSERAAVEELFS